MVFALLQAVGSGIFIANVSLIGASLGVAESSRLRLTKTVSYANCAGRSAVGFLMDFFEPRGVPRSAHTMGTSFLLVLVAASLSFLPEQLLETVLAPCLQVVGLAYGANWAIMPSFLKTWFGDEHLGIIFN